MNGEDGGRNAVVKLIEPDLCLSCRFSNISTVVENGYQKRMMGCSRKDCDNWEFIDQPKSITILSQDFHIPRD